MKSKAAWGRIWLGLVGALLFAVLVWIGPASTEEKSDWALGMLATALSILAGILLAVITLIGDAGSLYPGSWRVASAHRRQIRPAINRCVILFWLYLGVVAVVFSAAMLDAYESSPLSEHYVSWIKHVALSAGSVALLWSFSLPSIIRKAQLERLDREVERRKQRSQTAQKEAGMDEAAD